MARPPPPITAGENVFQCRFVGFAGEVIGDGQRGVAECLDLPDLLHPRGPRLHVPDTYTKAERLYFRTASLKHPRRQISPTNSPPTLPHPSEMCIKT
jgi:hypothetical protein